MLVNLLYLMVALGVLTYLSTRVARLVAWRRRRAAKRPR